MILDANRLRGPLRPPVFLDQLAATWAADCSKKQRSSHSARTQTAVAIVAPTTTTIARDFQVSAIAQPARPAFRAIPALVSSGKMGPRRYYLVMGKSEEADARSKHNTRTQPSGGRKPKAKYRVVGISEFGGSVPLHELRGVYGAYCAY